jgi:hypothetical protein
VIRDVDLLEFDAGVAVAVLANVRMVLHDAGETNELVRMVIE